MNKDTIKIGIMPLALFKQRTLAIAKGLYQPKKDEPKIWFSSIKSLTHVLSEKNQLMLRLIDESHPQSISALSKIVGRSPNNLLRTLKTMEKYGLVEFSTNKSVHGKASLMPRVCYHHLKLHVNINGAR